ncbi:hypothetical protein [Paenibacillus dendritiformis]|uniref:hypothetical protein n=1 Tax=Paenibacillus dendritiformis TaxID=130049 RepID=UPI0011B503D4|nr:hypothetical protein [Paenibacillus dendritiformis]
MLKIYRTYADTEVAVLATEIECPHCGATWMEIDVDECGQTFILTCDNEECGKQFEMHFDAD